MAFIQFTIIIVFKEKQNQFRKDRETNLKNKKPYCSHEFEHFLHSITPLPQTNDD